MTRRSNTIKSLMSASNKLLPPKGELWVSPATLEKAGFANNVIGLGNFTRHIGADICFLSVDGFQPILLDTTHLKNAVTIIKALDLTCGAVVSGPWQNQVNQDGLFPVLERASIKPENLNLELNLQLKKSLCEIDAWRKAGVDLIILADDIACNQGLYMSIIDYFCTLSPLYKKVMDRFIGKTMRPLIGFHSDGKLSSVMPDLVRLGFPLFSIEPETNQLEHLTNKFSQIVFMSGVKSSWLINTGEYSQPKEDDITFIAMLAERGSIVISSACGLYDPSAFTAIKRVYEALDAKLK